MNKKTGVKKLDDQIRETGWIPHSFRTAQNCCFRLFGRNLRHKKITPTHKIHLTRPGSPSMKSPMALNRYSHFSIMFITYKFSWLNYFGLIFFNFAEACINSMKRQRLITSCLNGKSIPTTGSESKTLTAKFRHLEAGLQKTKEPAVFLGWLPWGPDAVHAVRSNAAVFTLWLDARCQTNGIRMTNI